MARIGGNRVQGCERPWEKAPSVPPKSAVWGSTGEMVGKAHAERPGWEETPVLGGSGDSPPWAGPFVYWSLSFLI